MLSALVMMMKPGMKKLLMMLLLVMTSCWQDRVARKYITAMLQNNLLRRKVNFTR